MTSSSTTNKKNSLSKLQIVAHIPARQGSQRVREKNLKLLGGIPLIAHAIKNAQGSKRLSRFFVNTESLKIANVASSFGADIYLRDPWFADDEVTQDDFNYDFVTNVLSDVMVLINPVCPLVTSNDIDEAIDYFLKENLDSLISVTTFKLHSFVGENPVNFSTETNLSRTQDIPPVHVCNWAINIWKTEKFIESFKQNGHGVFVGKYGLYEIPSSKSLKISTEEDFKFAERLLRDV